MKKHLVAVFALILLATQSTVAEDQASPSLRAAPVTQQGKHISAKDDLTAIGRRNLGNKGFGNWYSLESDIQMGKEYSKAVDATVTLIDDPVVLEYVNRIGQNLVRHSDAQVPFTIKVINADEINAFSLPGGFLYVNYGAILAAQDEAELAGVMAHEIAHVAARHAARQMTRSTLFKLASLPLTFVGGGVAIQAARAVASLAMPMGMMKFSRGFEAEADYLGLEYLYSAGYDPHAFITFLERTAPKEKKKSKASLDSMFATHPNTAGRVQKGQQEIARILPPRETYVVNTSDFEAVRAHLLNLENRQKQTNDVHGGPVLRRKSADAGTPDAVTGSAPSAASSQEGGTPPTLKRKDN